MEKDRLLREKKRQEVCKPFRVLMLCLNQENLEVPGNFTAVSLSGKRQGIDPVRELSG